MAARTAIDLADSLVYTATGRHLNDLQRTILQQAWLGYRYLDIASGAGYTEGHIKDVASQLWRLLSKVTGEKVTKQTLKSALERRLVSLGADEANPLAPVPISPQPTVPLGLSSLLGREAAVAELDRLVHQGHRAIVIQGEGGLGKTTLAQHYLAQRSTDLTLELMLAQHPADLTPAEWVVDEWLREDFGTEPGREFGVSLDRLRRQLRQRRALVLIDNLEPCLDGGGRFVAEHRRYRELLRVLTDGLGGTLTLMTSRDRLCEPGIPVAHYRLPGLDLATWATHFRQRPDAVPAPLAAMHRAYGGNAKAMEILHGMIQADFDGDLAAYWQLHQRDLLAPADLGHLVHSQIDRLRQLDPAAYRLFCRLGVLRFQEVPPVPLAALAALAPDLTPAQQRQAVRSLQNRSLLECRRGRYRLHPAVRAGAVAQLRQIAPTEAESAHRHAAHYWTTSVLRITTTADALQALEAYYHYLAIADYDAAAQVILHSRHNQWHQFLPLGSTLYRLGLIQPVTEAITAVIDHIPRPSAAASELSNILGDLHWIRGQIQAAIACQENALAQAQACTAQLASTATPHRRYCLTMLAVDSQLSLGLYHLDLAEWSTAEAHFRQVIAQASGTRHQPWADKATVCLAGALSHPNTTPKAIAEATALADGIAPTLLSGEHSSRQAFFSQLLGHAYLNLGQWQRAEALLKMALRAAVSGHYRQIQGNALSGLGRWSEGVGQLETALTYHQQAIALLEEVGAPCDLAKAYLYLAPTLHYLGQSAAAAEALTQAEGLFAAIPAPRQRERVAWMRGKWGGG